MRTRAMWKIVARILQSRILTYITTRGTEDDKA